jgi:hypothetical protein
LLHGFKDGSISTNRSETIVEVDFRSGKSVAKNDSIGNSEDIVSEARLFHGQRTQSLNEEAIRSSLGSTKLELRQIRVNQTKQRYRRDRLTKVLLKTMSLFSKTVLRNVKLFCALFAYTSAVLDPSPK